MAPQPRGSGGIGLEQSCAPDASDWIRQSDVIDGVELWEARLLRFGYRRHRHDTYAIGITESGVQAFSYRGATHFSTQGHVVVLHPDEPHDGHSGTEAGFAYRQLYIEPALIFEAVRAICGRARALPFVRQPVMTNSALAAAIQSAFRQDREPLATDGLIVRVAECLLRADPEWRRPDSVRRYDSSAIERARQFLSDETNRVIHSSELEALTGLTRYELARQFRAIVGTSPHRYSLLRRLTSARSLIANGKPLVDVALETGFADQAHFSRRFGAAFGMTPGQFRALAALDRH